LAQLEISVPEAEASPYEYSPEYGVSIGAQKIFVIFSSGTGDQTIYTHIKGFSPSITK
jgi:hypothetical protein